MSDSLVAPQPSRSPVKYQPPGVGAGQAGSSPEPAKSPLERPIAAIRRYKWLMMAVVTVSTILGIVGLRYITPLYEVRAIIVLESSSRQNDQQQSGPIRLASALGSSASVELLRSYRVVDAVVRKLNLYLQPEQPLDAPLFVNFTVVPDF